MVGRRLKSRGRGGCFLRIGRFFLEMGAIGWGAAQSQVNGERIAGNIWASTLSLRDLSSVLSPQEFIF